MNALRANAQSAEHVIAAIATVVLNRPAKLNALTKPMWRALGAAQGAQ